MAILDQRFSGEDGLFCKMRLGLALASSLKLMGNSQSFAGGV